MFESQSDAELFHLWIGEPMDAALPPYDDGYVLIGGTAAMGNVATCLAYCLGFRDLHCYGYDSSHRGANSHAFEQKMNAGEPLVVVPHRGTNYLTSFTMRSQASTFLAYADLLISQGCSITLHGDGLLPAMWAAHQAPVTAESEAAKYKRIWSQKSYRQRSPGLEAVAEIRRHLTAPAGSLVIDFGCGSGRAAAALTDTYRVIGIDFADNALEPEPRSKIGFVLANLWELPAGLTGAAGICCDVMEHVPPAYVDAVLSHIAAAVPQCFFTIAHEPDCMGELIGERLHLTVKDQAWWTATLSRHFARVDALGDGKFVCNRG